MLTQLLMLAAGMAGGLAVGGAGAAVWRRPTRVVDAAPRVVVVPDGSPDGSAAVIDLLPEPFLILGEDRSLRLANRAARALLADELSALLRHPAVRGGLDRLEGTEQASVQVALILPSPVARDLQATLIDLRGAGQGFGIAVSDRTASRALERMRADFVANASHELRTPLASLVGFIDTLRGPAADDPPAQQEFLAIMAAQAARMARLIDDLLSLSRIELTEHLPLEDRVELGEMVRRVVAALEPARKAAAASIEAELQEGLPAVWADADQMEQVLTNLIDNALKYGRPGGVVRVGLHRAAGPSWPARPGVVLAVADEGAGIPRAHLARLTERFYRVDRGRSRAAGGTGLGLAIVKHIVSRHRGQLAIDSVEGKGSVFSVWLPLSV